MDPGVAGEKSVLEDSGRGAVSQGARAGGSGFASRGSTSSILPAISDVAHVTHGYVTNESAKESKHFVMF
eukprot:1385418-Amorphochlora_amoeboformis.AAC.1